MSTEGPEVSGRLEVAAGSGDGILEPAAAEGSDEPVKFKWPKRLNRKEKGSYVTFADEVMEELEMSPELPASAGPVYDLGMLLPDAVQPQMQAFDLMMEALSEDPELTAALDEDTPPEPPFPGARPILQWELRAVMTVGPTTFHPANRKAKCRVYLRDLQEQAQLTDDALQHIARIAGPRYERQRGLLTLTSERYPDREDNRRDILDTLDALVAEGRRAFPGSGNGPEQRAGVGARAAQALGEAGDVAGGAAAGAAQALEGAAAQ